MNRKAALAGLLAAAISLGAAGAAALGIHSDKARKVLAEAANALRNSDPTTASILDEIAQRGESVSVGEQTGLSLMDQDTLNRAASELRPWRPGLAKKVDKILKRESKRQTRRSLNESADAAPPP